MNRNEGRKPDKNSSLRRLELMPRNLNLKCRLRIPSPVSVNPGQENPENPLF